MPAVNFYKRGVVRHRILKETACTVVTVQAA